MIQKGEKLLLKQGNTQRVVVVRKVENNAVTAKPSQGKDIIIEQKEGKHYVSGREVVLTTNLQKDNTLVYERFTKRTRRRGGEEQPEMVGVLKFCGNVSIPESLLPKWNNFKNERPGIAGELLLRELISEYLTNIKK